MSEHRTPIIVQAIAQQDFKDGAGPEESPYARGSYADKVWRKEMARLYDEEAQSYDQLLSLAGSM